MTRFCRRCGARSREYADVPAFRGRATFNSPVQGTAPERPCDADELVGTGISKVITGDGFLMVAVLLGVTDTSISSLLWLLLLLPAFYLFGRGFSDVFQARQLRRRGTAGRVKQPACRADLAPPQVSVADLVTSTTTGKLTPGLDRFQNEPRGV